MVLVLEMIKAEDVTENLKGMRRDNAQVPGSHFSSKDSKHIIMNKSW
jgi:hypothetical protein